MTYWIIERMVYPLYGGQQHWSAGTRVSHDGGLSWIVAGQVHVGAEDSFQTRTREIDAREYAMRCQRSEGRTLSFIVPDPMRAPAR